MTLPQTLEQNEDGTRLNDGRGNFLGYEDITIVTEEQLAEEAEAKQLSDVLDRLPDTNPVKLLWKRLVKKRILP